MSDWFLNGQSTDVLAVNDRATQYGDGVFETIAIRDSQPRFWPQHFARLQYACDQLGLACPPDNILHRDLERALARSTVNTSFCIAKIVVSAGSGKRGYRRSEKMRPASLIGVFASKALDRSLYEQGVNTLICKTPISTQPALAGIKSLNCLDQILARREWVDEYFEGLMCDEGKQLICGTRTNVYVVRRNSIFTPKLTRSGVAGIMRGQIRELLAANGIDCAAVDISVDELAEADEVFLSNSQIGVLPVRRCEAYRWSVGEATRSVMALLSYHEVPECRL